MRVDIITRDTAGVYIDGKWTLADSVRVIREDPPSQALYSMDGTIVRIEQADPTWIVQLTLPSLSGPVIEYEVHGSDGDIRFWSTHELYADSQARTNSHTYVIEEMYL